MPRERIRYALFALPGPGDEVLRRTSEVGLLPAIVVAAQPGDFIGIGSGRFRGIARVDYGSGIGKLFRNEGIDAVMVAGWDARIPEDVIEGPSFGGWNIHPSLLPRLRGHNPYFWAIARGETATGVTVHKLTDRFDAGPVLFRTPIEIPENETLGGLWCKLAALSGVAAVELLRRLLEGELRLTAQDETQVTFAPRISPERLVLDPTMSCVEAERFVRASNPFYGALYRSDSGEVLHVFETGAGAGPILRFRDGNLSALVLKTTMGFVSGESYLRGQRRA